MVDYFKDIKNWTPQEAYEYALEIHEPFPEGEPIIAKDPEWAFYYAKDVLNKNRFPLGELAIAKDPEWAGCYALDVIKSRWPEAEPAIAKDPWYAYNYARDVIKGQWLEGEPIIAKDPSCAYKYALNIIKDRWPKAEETILNSQFKQKYIDDVLKAYGVKLTNDIVDTSILLGNII